MKVHYALMVFCLFLCTTFSPVVHARKEVESSERLRFLRKATGSDTSSSSFQARVDAVLNPTAEPERSVVARQDARRKEALTTAIPETTFYPEFTVSPEDSETKEEQLLEPRIETRDDAREETHQIRQEKISQELTKETEERRAAAVTRLAERTIKEAKEAEEELSLRPSLAYNPFYFAPISKDTFEENKPIIISRLAQQGWDSEWIEDVMSRCTTVEDLILILMREENYKYGEALEIARVS